MVQWTIVIAFCLIEWSGVVCGVGSICERIENRHMKWELGDGLPAEHLRKMVHRSPGDELTLSKLINNLSRIDVETNIEPVFSGNMNNKAATNQLAMLLSGQVRTMMEPDVLEGYKIIIKDVKNAGFDIHIFAYLELTGGKLYRRHHLDPKVSGPFVPCEYRITKNTVKNSIASLGQSYNLSIHEGDQHEWPEVKVCKNSQVSSQAQQFLKVAAVISLMKSVENEKQFEFDAVLRIRPDMCALSIRRFVQFSLNHTFKNSLLPYLVKDAVAIFPRWAVDAYGAAWRTFIQGCPIDPEWHRKTCPSSQEYCLGGSIDTHLIGLGIEALDLHKFWVPDSMRDFRNTSNTLPNEPTLRRPHGCVSFN